MKLAYFEEEEDVFDSWNAGMEMKSSQVQYWSIALKMKITFIVSESSELLNVIKGDVM